MKSTTPWPASSSTRSCWPGRWNRTAPIRENVEIIINQTMRCQQIVNRLLDFSRQSLGQKRLFDVNEVLRALRGPGQSSGLFP